MGSLFDWITDWIKEGLIEAITGQYTSIFESVNSQVADVAGQVGQTPQGWNGGVFSMIQNLSETVVIPIAGMILTFVLVYELIQMILEKNNMHDFDTFNIFKWIFKTFVATYLLTNCFTIVMAVFDVAQNVVSRSAGVINGNLPSQEGTLAERMDAFEGQIIRDSYRRCGTTVAVAKELGISQATAVRKIAKYVKDRKE